jgi:hypothetical protein
MSAAATLMLARAAGVQVGLEGDFLRYRSRGEAPSHVIAAIRLAKPGIIALLKGYTLDASGTLWPAAGDDLLVPLAQLGFRVRRYGDQAGIDDDNGVDDLGRSPPMPLLYLYADRQRDLSAVLIALGAPDRLAGLQPSAEAPQAPADVRRILADLDYRGFDAIVAEDGSLQLRDRAPGRKYPRSPPPALASEFWGHADAVAS